METTDLIFYSVLVVLIILALLKGLIKRVLDRLVENLKEDPKKLKKIVAEIADNTAKDPGANTVLLQNADIRKELDDKIDSGEIKTLGQLKEFFEGYQKK